MAKSIGDWVSFSDLFAMAAEQNRDCVAVAELFLLHLRHPASEGRVQGIRRTWQDSEENALGYVEVQRDFRLKPVPSSAWTEFENVTSDLESRWVDDEEEPESSLHVDWVAGILEFGGYAADTAFPDIDDWLWLSRSNFSGLRVDRQLAELLLSPPAPSSAAVAPSPPFSDKERRDWIRRRGREGGGADEAHAEFKKHPRFDGTKQPEFRKECRELWGPQKGRPKKRKEKT